MVSNSDYPPPMFHAFFSFVIGVMTAHFVRSHQVGMLVATPVLWVLSLVFINARARRATGKFLGEEAIVYHGFGISSYVAGLFLGACYLVVIG